MRAVAAKGVAAPRAAARGVAAAGAAAREAAVRGAAARASGRTESTPRRVRITSPRSQARRRGPSRPLRSEIGEQTDLGEVYVTSLLRTQLRLALVVLGGVLLAVLCMPALRLLAPDVADLRVGPVPLSWLLVSALLYPFLIMVARSFARAAERVEGDFEDLVRRR